MKISLVREKLIKSLGSVLRIVSNQVTLPILSNIMLSSDNGRLKIAATDLELGMETWIGAKITKEGSITVPAKLFFELVNSITDEKIELEVIDNKIKINGTKTKSMIKGLSANDFPLIPRIKSPIITSKINSGILKNSISKTGFASATDETRPVLTGVLLKFTKDNYTLAATDSYRLSEAKIPHTNKLKNDLQVIVPKRTMNELIRIIDDNEDEVNVEVGENQIVFSLGDIYFISRIIEGSFPEYEQIIPKKFETELEVNRKELIDRLKTAMIFSRESANNIKVKIDSKAKVLSIKSYSQQLGENESEINLSKTTGNNVNFSINASYFIDALNAISGDFVTLKLVNSISPILIKSEKDVNYLCIIMPLRQEE